MSVSNSVKSSVGVAITKTSQSSGNSVVNKSKSATSITSFCKYCFARDILSTISPWPVKKYALGLSSDVVSIIAFVTFSSVKSVVSPVV